jgi:hypothetical protein
MALINGAGRMFPIGTAVVKVPAEEQPGECLMAAEDEELDEQIAIVNQKIEATRKRCEAVPIGLQIDLERLIEEKRSGRDPNFKDGRI